jgi:dynein heavy chain
MTAPIVDGTIEVYTRICTEKLPIPSKFHYTFNLRDVSKVFQGIMMCTPSVIRDDPQVTRLWIHEVSRVFHDRLINDIDKDWFKDLIAEILGR